MFENEFIRNFYICNFITLFEKSTFKHKWFYERANPEYKKKKT